MEAAKRRVHELHAAGQHEEADRLAKRLDGENGRQGEQPNRMQHIAEAIEHLRAAGLSEHAERIEQMMREQQKSEGRGREQSGPREGTESMHRAMRETQEQMKRAIGETQEEMRRALKETHEKMMNMQRAIDELREQVSKR